MRFYIDFENVGNAGLVGIEALTEKDCVRIYYSNNPNVNMDTAQNMLHSSAKIQFIKLLDSLKKMNLQNALDIILLTDIARIAGTLGENYAVVISGDKGYDAVISEINSTNQTNRVQRSHSIKSFSVSQSANTVLPVVDEKALDQLFTQILSKYIQDKDSIIKIAKTSETRCEINNRICQTFDSTQSKVIMGALKPIIKILPGQ